MRVKVTKDALAYQPKEASHWIVRDAQGELTIAAKHITQDQAPDDITIKELGLIKDVLGKSYAIGVIL